MPKDDREIYREQATITRAIVEFHSDDNHDGPIIIGARKSNINIGKLISVSTNKTLGAPSGTWTVVTKRDALNLGQSLHERGGSPIGGHVSLLRVWAEPEDVWVRIKWVVDGQIIDGMWGLVDSIRESTTRMPDGSREETYTIVGRDIGKIFETLKLWVHHFDPGKIARSSYAWMNSIKDKQSGSPSHFVRALLEGWLGNNNLGEGQWKMPESLGGGQMFYQFLERSIQDMDLGHGLLHDPTLMKPERYRGEVDLSLWSHLLDHSNDLLNEMWVDTGPDSANPDSMVNMKPHFYFRERPFPTFLGDDRWKSITMRTLELGDVHRRELVKGGSANLFNFWTIENIGDIGASHRLLLQAGSIDNAKPGEPGNLPIVDFESLQKHGLRAWNKGSRYLPLFGPQKVNYLNVAANWCRRVFDWYSIAPFQTTGTITLTRVMPEIRVGERIREKRPDGNIQYYCEGIENSWAYPNNGKSVVTVTRGEYEGTTPVRVVYDRVKNPEALTATDCAFVPASREDDLALIGGGGGDGAEFLEQLKAGCKFTAVDVNGEDAEFGFSIPDVGGAPSAGALAGEAADALESELGGLSGEPREAPANQDMVPPDDSGNTQAAELTTNPNATIRKPPPSTFGKPELEAGDDPLQGVDDDPDNDPLSGIDPITQADRAVGI